MGAARSGRRDTTACHTASATSRASGCYRPPPSGRCRRRQRPVAPGHRVVELLPGRSAGPLRSHRPAPPPRHVQQDDQVGPEVVGRPGGAAAAPRPPALARTPGRPGSVDVAVAGPRAAPDARAAAPPRPRAGPDRPPSAGPRRGRRGRWCGRRAAGTAGRHPRPYPRLPGVDRTDAGRQAGRLRRLAARLAPLEDDEPAHGRLRRGFLAADFFAAALAAASAAAASRPPPSWLGPSWLPPSCGRRALAEPASRRAWSSSAARSIVRSSTRSPSRSRRDALVSPSVT